MEEWRYKMITNYLEPKVFLKYFSEFNITKSYISKIVDVENCRKIREFEEVSNFGVYLASIIPYGLNDSHTLTFHDIIKTMEEQLFLEFKRQIKNDKIFKDYDFTKDDFYNQQFSLKHKYCQLTLKRTSSRLETTSEAITRIQKEIGDMKKIYNALVNSSIDINILDQLQNIAVTHRHKNNLKGII
jgi:hypothetical protein